MHPGWLGCPGLVPRANGIYSLFGHACILGMLLKLLGKLPHCHAGLVDCGYAQM